jgi:type VI secretion system protein ImpK
MSSLWNVPALYKNSCRKPPQPERVKAEGRGEINPVAPNNTPENRARNRRVEITLLVSPENTQAELNGLPQGN